MVAAGLAPEEFLAATGNRWSKERILEVIHARQREGKPINYSAIRREDSALISAARRYFGNWSKALLAAGVDVERRTS
jgi:lipase chaperone LimK